MIFQWSLTDDKSPQISRTLFHILSDLNNAVVWIVSTRPVIFKSSRPCTNHLVTVPWIPITIGINVTFMFHCFFPSKAKSWYSFRFLLMSKSHRSLCVSFSRTDSGLCIYHLFVWLNLNLLNNSLWITWPTQSCLVLFSFRSNLLHSLMWLIVSSITT